MKKRLTKLEAAAVLEVSPSTIDRMIQRQDLTIEKESRGSRYKVWVLLDEESDSSADEAPEGSGDSSPEVPGGEAPDVSEESSAVELATMRERNRSLEELADHHRQLLKDSEWRYQQLLQQLESSQRTVETLSKALPAGTPAEKPQRRRWWSFGRRSAV